MRYTRVIMVHIVTNATVSYSHGLASLAGVLIQHGTTPDTLRLVVIRNEDMDAAAVAIANDKPSIVLVTAMSNQWDRAVQLAESFKSLATDIPIVVGGAHVTALPKAVSSTYFDLGIAGEAENLISNIVHGGSLATARVIDRVKSSQPSSIVTNLDELPLPYLSIFDKQDILDYPSLLFSRGCPYLCSYCVSGRTGGEAGQVRWKSPERAIREVGEMVSYANPDELNFDDDTILKNPRWVRTFCRLYKEKFDLPFYCNARPETVKDDLARALREAGCVALGIGIESGSESIRRNVLNRRMTDERILKAFDAAHRAGLSTWSFNMVGMPGETEEDLEATIEINERAQTEFVRVSLFTAYPGTPLYDKCRSSGKYPEYFRDPADLSDSMRGLYESWISKLQKEGRLWLTDSELTAIESGKTQRA